MMEGSTLHGSSHMFFISVSRRKKKPVPEAQTPSMVSELIQNPIVLTLTIKTPITVAANDILYFYAPAI